ELQQGLADGCSRDSQLGRDVHHGVERARGQLTRDDGPADRLVGLGRQRRLVRRDLLQWIWLPVSRSAQCQYALVGRDDINSERKCGMQHATPLIRGKTGLPPDWPAGPSPRTASASPVQAARAG